MKTLYGNIAGINKTTLAEMESLYDVQVPKNQVGDIPLFEKMLSLSERLGREIAVYLNRSGQVVLVACGSKFSAEIPFLTERRSQQGLTKLGCIHTHPSGNPDLSPADYSTMENFRLDFMCAIALRNEDILASCLFPGHQAETGWHIFAPQEAQALLEIAYLDLIQETETRPSERPVFETRTEKEKALLFVPYYQLSEEELREKVAEFRKLAESAGLEVLDIYTQNQKSARTIIGKGKVEELLAFRNRYQPDCLLVDAPLSPSLENSLSETLRLKIIDRTNLILDIFAQRAKSNEGKIQVELAQLRYLLPRIMGQGLSMSRLGGGVGTRGPGETQLETDRRHIRRRINALEQQLESMKSRRGLQKQNRIKKELPLVSLVGYTNSGKSTLLTTLSSDSIYAEDLLFATLDTTTRSVSLDDKGKQVLITDTVGFISNIPHQLISAFKSTLEEVVEADLLLHVIDISNPNWEQQMQVVNEVLKELKALDKEMLYVFNKIDAVDLSDIHPAPDRDFVCISAKTGEGIPALLQKIEAIFFQEAELLLLIPYTQPRILALAHANGQVKETRHLEEGTEILLRTDKKNISLFSAYLVENRD